MPVRWKVPRLTLTVILLAVQSVLMLLEPPLWLVWQIALFGAVAAQQPRDAAQCQKAAASSISLYAKGNTGMGRDGPSG